MKQIINPIGIIHSPYSEKFAVPRQPNLVTEGQGELHLLPPYNNPDAIKGLEQFSHLWLLFQFHQIELDKWRLTVRPPRLGGNKTLGVFATRSPFRPNHIGLSAVALKDIVIKNKQVILKLGSVDLVDGTPVIDIKPYLPYCDSYPEAIAGYAQAMPDKTLTVEFSKQAQQSLKLYQLTYPNLATLITQVIAQDPRPAYKQKSLKEQDYGFRLYHFNIKCRISDKHAIVEDIDIEKNNKT